MHLEHSFIVHHYDLVYIFFLNFFFLKHDFTIRLSLPGGSAVKNLPAI